MAESHCHDVHAMHGMPPGRHSCDAVVRNKPMAQCDGGTGQQQAMLHDAAFHPVPPAELVHAGGCGALQPPAPLRPVYGMQSSPVLQVGSGRDQSFHEEDVPPVPPRPSCSSDVQEEYYRNELNHLLSVWKREIGLRSTTVGRIFRRIKVSENQLVEVLERASATALNKLLQSVNLAGAMCGIASGKAKFFSLLAGYVATHPSDEAFREQSSHPRLHDLDLLSKFAVLDGFQKVSKRQCPYRGEFICNIMLTLRGGDLNAMRSLLDSKGSYYNLHHLVYHDVDDPIVRGHILSHIAQNNWSVLSEAGQAAVPPADSPLLPSRMRQARNASRVRAQRYSTGSATIDVEGLVSSSTATRAPSAGLKIVSDIDDTCLASFGPGGIDRRLPSGTVYPGVVELYYRLDFCSNHTLGGAGCGWNMQGNFTLLTARPTLYKGVSMRASHSQFAALIATKGLHAVPNILSGSIKSAAPMLLGNSSSISEKKLSNFHEYKTLYPEAGFVFFGDNGQGDEVVARKLAKAYPDHCKLCCIHVVQPIDRSQEQKMSGLPIVYCENYVQAALAAFDRGLLTTEAVHAVAEAAVKEYHTILHGVISNGPQFSAALEMLPSLQREVGRVNELVHGRCKPLSLDDAVRLAA